MIIAVIVGYIRIEYSVFGNGPRILIIILAFFNTCYS